MALYKGTSKLAETIDCVSNLNVATCSCVHGNETIDGTVQPSEIILPNKPSTCEGAMWLENSCCLGVYTSGNTRYVPLHKERGTICCPALAVNTTEGVKYAYIYDTTLPAARRVAWVVPSQFSIGCFLSDECFTWSRLWSCSVCYKCSGAVSVPLQNYYTVQRGDMCAVMYPPSVKPTYCICRSCCPHFVTTSVQGAASYGVVSDVWIMNASLSHCICCACCACCYKCTDWSYSGVATNVDTGWKTISSSSIHLPNTCGSYRKCYCSPRTVGGETSEYSSVAGSYGAIIFCQGASGSVKGGPNHSITASLAAQHATVCAKACTLTRSATAMATFDTEYARWCKMDGGITPVSYSITGTCAASLLGVCSGTYTLCGYNRTACEYATVIDHICLNDNVYGGIPLICFRYVHQNCMDGDSNYCWGHRGLRGNVTSCDCPIIKCIACQACYAACAYANTQINCYKFCCKSASCGNLLLCASSRVPICDVLCFSSGLPTRGWKNGVASVNVPCRPEGCECWCFELWGWI